MDPIKISFDILTTGKSKEDKKIIDDILAILLNHPSIDNVSIKKNNKVDNISDIEEYEDNNPKNEEINEINKDEEIDMDTSINDLDLSVRALNVLNRKYDILYDLSNITIEDLWNMRGLGADTIKEIVDKLYDKGIYIEHETIKNIKTGQVKYVSKNDMHNYKYWVFA